MDALTYLKTYGDEHCAKMAERAGTTLGYFRLIAYRHRRPSVTVARKLEAASRKAMSATELVFVDLKPPKSRRRRTA
jgi:hypothetical protein